MFRGPVTRIHLSPIRRRGRFPFGIVRNESGETALGESEQTNYGQNYLNAQYARSLTTGLEEFVGFQNSTRRLLRFVSKTISGHNFKIFHSKSRLTRNIILYSDADCHSQRIYPATEENTMIGARTSATGRESLPNKNKQPFALHLVATIRFHRPCRDDQRNTKPTMGKAQLLPLIVQRVR